jgi:phytoene dehydrogenase-like protein
MNAEVDMVVIGSGIAGLSCAALLARCGFEVIVCESHTIPGGAAHSFERDSFKFDSGPYDYGIMYDELKRQLLMSCNPYQRRT